MCRASAIVAGLKPAAVGLVVLAVAFGVLPRAASADALLDAKRQAADKLLRDGKTDEAATLLSEVAAAEGAQYQDYLQLGRVSEKLGKDREAAAAYRKVMEMVGEHPRRGDEVKARNEARQKLATLDVLHGKLEALVKDTEKRVQDLAREAEKGGDWEALGRLLKLYAALCQVRDESDVHYEEVQANQSYQGGSYKMVQGKTYRIRAAGRWRLAPRIECTPDGSPSLPATANGPAGALLLLLAQNNENYRTLKVGSELILTAPLSGQAKFVINEDLLWETKGKEDNSGSLHVLIERVD